MGFGQRPSVHSFQVIARLASVWMACDLIFYVKEGYGKLMLKEVNMPILPEGIVSSRMNLLRERHAQLSRGEQEYSTGAVGPLMLDVAFVAMFAAGVTYDTVRSIVRPS